MNTTEITAEQRIEQKLDLVKAGAIPVSNEVAGVQFSTMTEVMEFSKLMSTSRVAVRKHLRNNPGACLAIVLQALDWRMTPFAVANKSYEVNDQIAYEASLLAGLINTRAPLQKRPRYIYTGEGPEMRCKVILLFKGETEPHEWDSPAIKDIKPQNSPLWKTDPQQQLGYYSIRGAARRHCPEVILGIYDVDELEGSIQDREMTDITPAKPDIAARLPGNTEGAGFKADNVTVIDPKPEEKEQKPAATRRRKPTPLVTINPADPAGPGIAPDPKAEEEKADEAPVVVAAEPDADTESEWLDEKIAEANNIKDLGTLEELDPIVYRMLEQKGRKDLLPKWDTEGYKPNKDRLEAARAASRRRVSGDKL